MHRLNSTELALCSVNTLSTSSTLDPVPLKRTNHLSKFKSMFTKRHDCRHLGQTKNPRQFANPHPRYLFLSSSQERRWGPHEKLTSRSKVLLKLIKVAYALRDMDDFHSSMGALTGIEAQPVYRLDTTFKVVQQMEDSYLSLCTLSRFVAIIYRGTYLRDIATVNEVTDHMKDGKVNLTKMVEIAKSASAVLICNVFVPKIVFDTKISNLTINIMHVSKCTFKTLQPPLQLVSAPLQFICQSASLRLFPPLLDKELTAK
ncbi:hypothetical protein PCANC_02214 [Puccinia coronata f. sp. avenae]|uniref:Ras-GEF domain-containing protein n=1 Tax=Puccinia coronata f. sp. avenae TaxID=200324 RepID=A0A2N5W0S4_9BASI|nr:hypothetical protein PCANC_02214 [Puccinia coronata f. sp. avenae]